MKKRLYKSNSNRYIDGVCAGIAEYLGLDPTLVRLAWVIFLFVGGSGVLAYIVCALVIPRDPGTDAYDDSEPYDPQKPGQN